MTNDIIMKKSRNFREYKVWNDAVSFATEVYKVTDIMPSYEKKGICDQLRRAAVSISLKAQQNLRMRISHVS